MTDAPLPATVDATLELLTAQDYVAERRLATAVFLSLKLARPLFLEGEAGVGKTEIAKVLAAGLGKPLVRLQCYEGLDTAAAVYEWNYPRQMIEIRLAEAVGRRRARSVGARHLHARNSCSSGRFCRRSIPTTACAPVLLIDELDRTDEPFEAYLLEVLSDFQVSIPELGVVRASDAAGRGHHVQPHARDPRRDQAPLPVSLGRLSRRAARARDPAPQVPACARAARARDRRVHAAPAHDGPVQGAGHRRDARLGRGADRARPHRARSCRPWPTRSACCSSTRTTSARWRPKSRRGSSPKCRPRASSCDTAIGAQRAPSPCRAGRLAENVLHFVRVLRTAGLPVGPAKVIDAHRRRRSGRGRQPDRLSRSAGRRARLAARAPRALRAGVRPLLAESAAAREDGRGAAAARPRPHRRGRASRPSCRRGSRRRCCRRSRRRRTSEEDEVEVDAALTFSAREILQKKDFATMTADELAQVQGDAARGSSCRCRSGRSGARGPPARGLRIDLRATLRGMTGAAGAVAPLAFRARVKRRRRRWSCCATSRARWTATRACCCTSCMRSPTTAIACARWCSGRASPTSRATCGIATSTWRSRAWRRRSTTGRAGPASARASANSTAAGRAGCSGRTPSCS